MSTFTLAFWSEDYQSWVSFVVSSKRELVEAMSKRLSFFLLVPVRVVETSSPDDDAIEQALAIEPHPGDAAFADAVHPPGDLNR